MKKNRQGIFKQNTKKKDVSENINEPVEFIEDNVKVSSDTVTPDMPIETPVETPIETQIPKVEAKVVVEEEPKQKTIADLSIDELRLYKRTGIIK